jgi:hypothetical protein
MSGARRRCPTSIAGGIDLHLPLQGEDGERSEPGGGKLTAPPRRAFARYASYGGRPSPFRGLCLITLNSREVIGQLTEFLGRLDSGDKQ